MPLPITIESVGWENQTVRITVRLKPDGERLTLIVDELSAKFLGAALADHFGFAGGRTEGRAPVDTDETSDEQSEMINDYDDYVDCGDYNPR